MENSKLKELRKQLDAINKKRPQEPYKLNSQGRSSYSEGYTEEWQKWSKEVGSIGKAVYEEQMLEICKVLSYIHIPKGLAGRLARYGFNEMCYRTYYKKHDGLKKPMRFTSSNYGQVDYCNKKGEEYDLWNPPYELHSPTYDQVTEWFRDNYQIDFISSPEEGRTKQYRCDPISPDFGLINLPFCATPKEALLQAFGEILTRVKPLRREVVEDEIEEIEPEMADED